MAKCFTLFCHSRYIAAVDGVVNKKHLVAISEGTVIDGVHCTPDSVELLPKQPDMSRPRLRIVVSIMSLHRIRNVMVPSFYFRSYQLLRSSSLFMSTFIFETSCNCYVCLGYEIHFLAHL